MMNVLCEKLDHFGRGIGKVDGKIIFVPDLLPGEEALVKIVSSKKNFMVGEVIELKTKALNRVCSKCSYDMCGCALKNLAYEKTLEYKKEKVEDILRKFGGIDISVKEIVPSPVVYGYRNKVTLKVKDGRLGYFKNNSNDLLEIDECLIASEKINEIIRALKKEDLSKVSEIIIKDMDEVMVIIKGVLKVDNLKNLVDSLYMNDKLIYGKEKIFNHILDYKFLVSKDSFFQVNNQVTSKLYSKVLQYARFGEEVLDLYCGTGTISLFLSKQFKKVIGIEVNKEAIDCANVNKKLNGIDNVEFICGDANKLVSGLKADVIVVDPARAGLMKNGIDGILNVKPQRIVYVSCDPVTLARDLKEISKFYDVKEVTLYDMFPWTYHTECVSLLSLKTLEK